MTACALKLSDLVTSFNNVNQYNLYPVVKAVEGNLVTLPDLQGEEAPAGQAPAGLLLHH